MKWVASTLVGLGCLSLITGWIEQLENTRRKRDWNNACDHVRRFERRMPESALAQSVPQIFHLTIPNDHHWLHIARRLKPMFFIMNTRPEGLLLGPRPSNPLEPFAAELAVNQVAVALEVQTIRNEWGYAIPIRLGDRIDLRLIRLPVAQIGDGTLIWGVEFSGDKEDHPGFGWSMNELVADFLFWIGLGFVILGTLVVLLRRPPKADATAA